MADLRVSFTLGDRDLKHFRRVMAKAIDVANPEKEREVTAAAVGLLKRAPEAEPPGHVRQRPPRPPANPARTYHHQGELRHVLQDALPAPLSSLSGPPC